MANDKLFSDVKTALDSVISVYFAHKKILDEADYPGAETARDLCYTVLNDLLWLQALARGEVDTSENPRSPVKERYYDQIQ